MNLAALRPLALAASVALAAASAATQAAAQAAYPSQRTIVYVGFAAGGFADTVARVVSTRLGERLKQSFIVQNLEGGGGIRAARQTTIAPPDGYTMLVTTTASAINETLVPERGYKADQLLAVAIPVSAPESLSTYNGSGLKTLADVVAAAKAGKIYMGTPGIGSGSHLAAEYFFKNLVKTDVKHIPFGGGNPAMLGLMAKDVNLLASTATGATLRNMASGEVTGIAVAGSRRSALMPNVPTYAEGGYPGFEAASWVGFFVPAGTPTAIVDKLNAEINEIMQEEGTKKQIVDALGLEITLRNRADSNTYFRSEIGNWGKMVEAVGITQ
jgi:tripartite-type tricarboxylate transporter receptor subunit TctC